MAQLQVEKRVVTKYDCDLLLHPRTQYLMIVRGDGETVTMKVTKAKVQELIDLGVGCGS